MRKLLAWCSSHRFITIVVLLGAFEFGAHSLMNWRAESRWRSYCEAARARGVKLNLAEFIPPEAPDSENFAALPMFQALNFHAHIRPDDVIANSFSTAPKSPLSLLVAKGNPPSLGDPKSGRPLDWKEWQRYFQWAGFIKQSSDNPVQDVLAGLERYAPIINEWREWRNRPCARFPVEYNGWTDAFPHLAILRDAAKLFALRLRAHLALGDSPGAYMDFQDGLQGFMALKGEPALVSGETQISILSGVLSAAGDGLAAHRWAEPELRKIEADLTKIRIGDAYRFALSSERAGANARYNECADGSAFKRPGIASKTPYAWIFALIPRWCWRDNQLRTNRNYDDLLTRVSEDGSRFDPDAPNPSGPEHITGPLEKCDLFLFRIAAPAFAEVYKRYFSAEIKLRQTRLACVAERFRMANGAFPQTLADLVPAFIADVPLDIYSGQPMIYRQKGADSFLLYSVGSNRIDDHGVTDPHKSERQQLDEVWYFAPLTAP